MKKHWILVMTVILLLMLTACKKEPDGKKLLDPSNPITISVWNYYNGSVKEKFDSLVMEFNETIGAKNGLVVEAKSYGDVNELAEAVYNSANKAMGVPLMPDIFASYPENAFRINQITELVNLEDYFTEEELSKIRPEFLEEGRFGKDGKYKILPIAKSTEVLYVNKTYWEEFADKAGVTLSDLTTWEGINQVAKKYYDMTGKAFYSIDANANYMLVTAMQLDSELYHYQDEKGELNYSKENAKRIWENYYVPYLNGYLTKTGRFSSDDLKIGSVIAYTGSTAGASYFPVEVAKDDQAISIEGITLPYPYFKGGKPYAIQQGAGMCIARSDEAHEYAAAMFLKWFIDIPQNTQFAVSTAYLPVKSEALNINTILDEMKKNGTSNLAVQNSVQTAISMFGDYTLYGSKPFIGSYEIRNLLENALLTRCRDDLEELKKRVDMGESHQDVVKELTSEYNFEQWYQKFISSANKILEQ